MEWIGNQEVAGEGGNHEDGVRQDTEALVDAPAHITLRTSARKGERETSLPRAGGPGFTPGMNHV